MSEYRRKKIIELVKAYGDFCYAECSAGECAGLSEVEEERANAAKVLEDIRRELRLIDGA